MWQCQGKTHDLRPEADTDYFCLCFGVSTAASRPTYLADGSCTPPPPAALTLCHRWKEPEMTKTLSEPSWCQQILPHHLLVSGNGKIKEGTILYLLSFSPPSSTPTSFLPPPPPPLLSLSSFTFPPPLQTLVPLPPLHSSPLSLLSPSQPSLPPHLSLARLQILFCLWSKKCFYLLINIATDHVITNEAPAPERRHADCDKMSSHRNRFSTSYSYRKAQGYS